MPIAHSLSPVLHNTAYAFLGIDAEYGSREVDSALLAKQVHNLDDSFLGVSLTMPLKEAILPLVPEHRGVVDLVSAANTIVRGPEGLALWNTDPMGVKGALLDSAVTQVTSLLVLGAGATARSVIAGAGDLGVSHVTIASRSHDRAERTLAFAVAAGLRVRWVNLEENPALTPPDLVASTLPSGVSAPAWIDEEMVHHAALFDVAYSPWPSALATLWAGSGKPIASGLSMLVHQAVIQIRLFLLGTPDNPLPDEATMLSLMRNAVGLPAV